ncbi:spore coat protein [Planococcus salinus]|uniref:Spore coat protein n=1 Tax=Planococcus salinus TaxID=1848460 RepID=A0A3M8P5T7_9BACL|nr:spore coat protein [Planococcus salinus]RNF39037.1 spore coat protein [Planococcus salinus]
MAKKDSEKQKDKEKKKQKNKEKETKQELPDVAVIDDLVIATDLLVTAKAGVRNLAIAITETATPSVKKVLRRELDNAIDTHDKIAQYMIKNEMYHAYDIEEQVKHDLKKADMAIKTSKK